MAKFEKVRVSLARDKPGQLLAGMPEVVRTRQEFLVAAFAEPRQFLSARTSKVFGFSPVPAPDGYVAGFFKREKPLPARHADLSPYSAENYEIALFVLSTAKDQIGWMENNPKLGAPKPIIESFFSHMRQKTPVNDWNAVAHYMDSRGEYFETVRRHKAEIALLRFTFVPPNALGADDKVMEFVKLIQNEAHPETQQHTYRAPPGTMDPETPMLEASAQIAMAGGGEAEVRNGKGQLLYSSAGAKTTEEVPEEEMPTPDKPAFVRRVIARLFGQ